MFKLLKFSKRWFRLLLAFCSEFCQNIKYSLLGAAIALLIVASCVTTQTSEYRVMVTEPAIVRVSAQDKKASGTGFRFQYNGKTFIATAGHVCKSIQRTGQDPLVIFGNKDHVEKMIIVGLDTDACIISDSVGGPSLKLKFDRALFVQTVYTMGFSGVLGFTYAEGQTGQHIQGKYPGILLSQIDILECVAAGLMPTISTVGMVCPFSHEFLATNIPVYFGQSGSPLLNKDGEVIGILSMTMPNGSYWTTMEYFKPMIDRVAK